MQVKLKNVRIAFAQNLFEASSAGEGKPKFGATFLLDPKDPQVKAVNAAIDGTGKEKWGVKSDAIVKTLRNTDKVCLHDGDNKAQYAGFEGMLYISASNAVRPTVVNADKSPLVAADSKPYSGCYVNAVMDFWAQDSAQFGKRVNATVTGVQFAADGDSFGGGSRVASEDDFEDVSGGADADDLS